MTFCESMENHLRESKNDSSVSNGTQPLLSFTTIHNLHREPRGRERERAGMFLEKCTVWVMCVKMTQKEKMESKDERTTVCMFGFTLIFCLTCCSTAVF